MFACDFGVRLRVAELLDAYSELLIIAFKSRRWQKSAQEFKGIPYQSLYPSFEALIIGDMFG